MIVLLRLVVYKNTPLFLENQKVNSIKIITFAYKIKVL